MTANPSRRNRTDSTALHLKLYIYGYLHRIQSSRRLEQQPGQELQHGEGRETAQAIGGERGALSLPARHRGSA
jgi:hypothetical protein